MSRIRVSVAIALPSRQEVVEVELPAGATLADAIEAARLPERFPGVEPGDFSTGVWSRLKPPGTRLQDGDRVELYRPLAADAKAQRRARARLKPSSTRSRSGR